MYSLEFSLINLAYTHIQCVAYGALAHRLNAFWRSNTADVVVCVLRLWRIEWGEAGDIGQVSLAGDIGQVSLAGSILSDPIDDCEIAIEYAFHFSFNHSKALHLACDEDFNQIQEFIKDCKKKLEACKKKTEEAYSDESAGDDDIERLQKELDEDMELESKINDELR
ncbi:unnamed protein product [Brassica rapa subsp. trilocularis]